MNGSSHTGIIPFLALRGYSAVVDEEVDAEIARTIEAGDFVLDNTVRQFEKEWADYCGASYAVGVGSGLSALELSLIATGVVGGDEVLVPANTFIATWMAVSNVGATPIPVPTSREDFNIEVSQASSLLSEKTRAIIPVHLYGRPANLNAVHEFAQVNGLSVIEDAAQAHGADYQKKKIGSQSDAVAWSFYPGKNLGAYGDAGAVTTNSSHVAESIAVMRNYGSSKKYVHERIGTNSRLDAIQAAVLRAKLRHLDQFTQRRREIANLYGQSFRRLNTELDPKQSIQLPPSDDEEYRSARHLYVIRVSGRDGVREFLSDRGVETLIHYPIPPGSQAAYSEAYGAGVSEVSAEDSRSLLSLPIGPHLSDVEVNRVARLVAAAVQSAG